MENSQIDVFITNFGKYNEDYLVGEWVKLPITPEEMKAVYGRIEIDNYRYKEIFISDYETTIPIKIDEYSNVSELNYLAALLQEMDETEVSKLEAAIALDGVTTEEIIKLTLNLDCYTFLEGITNDSEYGDYLLYESGTYDERIPAEILMYIDTEALGRDNSINEAGIYTDKGYCIKNSIFQEKDYMTRKVPEQYLIGPYIMTERKSVLSQLSDLKERGSDISNTINNKKQIQREQECTV